ncbi:MAG: FtsQ-type POTRA domain-containing protein [Dehalococcoidia bacterium]
MSASHRRTGSSTRSRRQRPIKGHIVPDDRLERRLRRIRWRRSVVAVAIVGVIIGMVATYWSPLLRVQEIQIAGTGNVDAFQVAQLAALGGQSMLRLDLERAEASIEALPLVKSVEATRRWPHTAHIQITERLPWGYWQVGDATYVIDAEGVVLPDLPDVRPAEGAPVIEDLSSAVVLRPGDRVDSDIVVLVQATLERAPEALGISNLEYSAEIGLTLTTESGYRVVLGDSQNVDYKLAVWQALEQELGRDAMVGRTLDLRFQDRPSLP